VGERWDIKRKKRGEHPGFRGNDQKTGGGRVKGRASMNEGESKTGKKKAKAVAPNGG